MTPGAFGTVPAQNEWLSVLRLLGTRPWFRGRLAVPHAGKVFTEGQLTDADIRERLRTFIGGFVQSIRERQISPQ